MSKGKLLSPEGVASSSRMRRGALTRSRQQEERAAKRLGGERTSGSGNGWADKGDVKSSTLLIECKRTDKKQFTLRLAEVRLARAQALAVGKMPVLQVEMGSERLAVISWEDLLGLLGK